jgi:hypothetical protein
MSFSFFNNKNTSKTYAVFCISTSSVTLSVIAKTGDKEEVLFVSRFVLELDSEPTADKLLRLSIKKIDSIFEQVRSSKSYSLFNSRTEIIVMVGSPWHIGWKDEVSIERDKSFTVTKEFIDRAIIDSFNSAHKDLVTTSINIMCHRLNGYVMPNPVGKITKSLKLDVYISSVPKLFSDSITQAIKKHIPHHKIKLIPFNSCLNLALLETLSPRSFVVVVPENEVTEIFLVKDGVIYSEASIPFGGAALSRHLFGNESSSTTESIAKTKRFISGDLDIADLESIQSKLDSTKTNFVTNFRDILWKINNTLILPNTLYVVGKNIASHFVADWIAKEEYTSETMTTAGFTIQQVSGSDIAHNTKSDNTKRPLPICVAVSTKIISKI